MVLPLILLSMVPLLLAGAVELWTQPVRQQQRRSLAYLEKSLAGAEPASLPPGAATAPPRLPGEAFVRSLCARTGLSAGWRVPVQLVAPGLVLAALGAWRVGSAWALPAMLGVYAAGLWLWLHTRIEKLRRRVLRQLPDFLDAMVRLASIGNSLPMAFQTASAPVQMPLRRILDQTMRSVRTGLELDRALQLAAQPYRLEALELLHVVLGAGVRMGGRADHILQRMSDFMRDLDQAQRELRAITSETRMSAWVLGLLPIVVSIFMALFDPAFFRPMFTHPLGQQVLLAAMALEVFGGLLLYRLARSL